ncbi:MAG: hypothetical protein ACLFM0_01275 [Spirochaetales bacterium]
MAGYYYAVASLPSLFLDSEPPINWDELITFLRGQLSASDLRRLGGADLEEPPVQLVLDAARSAESTTTDEDFSESGDSESTDSEESSESLGAAAAEFRSFDRELRNALVRVRSDNPERIKKSTRPGDVGYASRAEEAAREAVNSDPLEAERYLDKVRFDFLNELEVGHHFDFENIVIYCLKLQIVARRASRTDEAGREVFERSYEAILARMGDIQNI